MTLLLTNDDLAQLIVASEFVEELDRAYRAYAAGVGVCPPRIDVQSAALGGGRNYQLGLAVGMADRYAALRIKSDVVFREIVEGRERKNKYCVEPGRYMGLVLVFDRADGALLAILHDGLLQKMRVGADSALGVRYLAREDAATIGILGSGGMARTHIAAVSAVRPSAASSSSARPKRTEPAWRARSARSMISMRPRSTGPKPSMPPTSSPPARAPWGR
jgi:alanine dehydrogenase